MIIRLASSGIILLAIVIGSRAEVAIAPPPREVGIAAPIPAKNTKPAANPSETMDEIVANTKKISDRLAKSDPGSQTRKTQDHTLELIDSLLNDPAPKANPPSSDASPSPDTQPKGNQTDMPMPDPQTNPARDPSPKKESAQPKEDRTPQGHRPRNEQARKSEGSEPEKGNGKEAKKSDNGNTTPGKDPSSKGKQPTKGTEYKPDPDQKGKDPTAVSKGGTGVPKPSLPLDDDVVKQVWGHLRDVDRQQITQYYKEQFIPRYSDLLRQYYSSLAESGKKSSSGIP